MECETCFLTLDVEHMVRVFENKVLTRMIGHMVAEVTGKWRKLYLMRNFLFYFICVDMPLFVHKCLF